MINKFLNADIMRHLRLEAHETPSGTIHVTTAEGAKLGRCVPHGTRWMAWTHAVGVGPGRMLGVSEDLTDAILDLASAYEEVES